MESVKAKSRPSSKRKFLPFTILLKIFPKNLKSHSIPNLLRLSLPRRSTIDSSSKPPAKVVEVAVEALEVVVDVEEVTLLVARKPFQTLLLVLLFTRIVCLIAMAMISSWSLRMWPKVHAHLPIIKWSMTIPASHKMWSGSWLTINATITIIGVVVWKYQLQFSMLTSWLIKLGITWRRHLMKNCWRDCIICEEKVEPVLT